MPGRLIAIGDIHGFASALAALLDAIQPQADDTIVTLGDYVDRGPDVPRTFRMLRKLASQCQLVPILGNHDSMLIGLYHGDSGVDSWLGYGGRETLAAYDCATPRELPPDDIAFLEQCRLYYETPRHFFVHGTYHAEIPLANQPADTLLWGSLRNGRPGPHCSGKIAIVGHTAQKDGRMLDLGYLKCIDTYCYGGGWLTALDCDTGRLWQFDAKGKSNGRTG
jgi:serine/threonine protein phosphatase 1